MDARVMVGLATLWLALPATVQAATCDSRKDVVARLATKYGEHLAATGPTNGAYAVVELFRSHDGKSWTLLLTKPNGESCFLAAGTDWSERKVEPPGDPT